MKIRCQLKQGEWFMELDCRSFHLDSDAVGVFVFMSPEWEAPYNEAAYHILGSACCKLEPDGTRSLLFVHAAVSAVTGARTIS